MTFLIEQLIKTIFFVWHMVLNKFEKGFYVKIMVTQITLYQNIRNIKQILPKRLHRYHISAILNMSEPFVCYKKGENL